MAILIYGLVQNWIHSTWNDSGMALRWLSSNSWRIDDHASYSLVTFCLTH